MKTYPVIRKKIPEKTYREIRRSFPLVCVDVVIADGKKFLLAKRTNQPEKGKWWIPGGRILKNEFLKDAAVRLLKQETGLKAQSIQFIGFDELLHAPGYFPGTTAHNVAFVFKAKIAPRGKFKLDSQNSDGKWFSKIDRSWHPYVKKFLREAGFK